MLRPREATPCDHTKTQMRNTRNNQTRSVPNAADERIGMTSRSRTTALCSESIRADSLKASLIQHSADRPPWCSSEIAIELQIANAFALLTQFDDQGQSAAEINDGQKALSNRTILGRVSSSALASMAAGLLAPYEVVKLTKRHLPLT